jgi:hypothetical protein
VPLFADWSLVILKVQKDLIICVVAVFSLMKQCQVAQRFDYYVYVPRLFLELSFELNYGFLYLLQFHIL